MKKLTKESVFDGVLIMQEDFDGHSEESLPFAYEKELLRKDGKPILLLIKKYEIETLICYTCKLSVNKLVGIPVQLKYRNYIYLCESCVNVIHNSIKL